jgi:two-component system NtrC family sensor kinase
MGYKRDIAGLDAQVVGAAAALGSSELAAGDSNEADRSLANLLSHFHGLKNNLRGQGKQIAQQLSDNERRAVEIAFALSGFGLLLAVGAALVMVRTLRPLSVLREHTKQIAGGDYARRTGIASRDEIGDLAREFDAMASAIEEREHKLIRSERLATVGRMAAHITHEIRNPLASLGLNVELLGDEVGRRQSGGAQAGHLHWQGGRPAERHHGNLPALRASAQAQARARGSGRHRDLGVGIRGQ